MEYNLSIRKDNIEAYLDIEYAIQAKLNGLFTFILRVNNGKICDFNVLEYVDARQKYFRLKEIVREEFIVLHYLDKGIGNTPLRPDDSQQSD